MRLRRFSQLGWHTCQDLAGFVMGGAVERVELGPPPATADWDWLKVQESVLGAELEASVSDGTEFFKVPGGLLHVTREWATEMGLDVGYLTPMAKCSMCDHMKPKQHADSWMPHDVCEDCYWSLPG